MGIGGRLDCGDFEGKRDGEGKYMVCVVVVDGVVGRVLGVIVDVVYLGVVEVFGVEMFVVYVFDVLEVVGCDGCVGGVFGVFFLGGGGGGGGGVYFFEEGVGVWGFGDGGLWEGGEEFGEDEGVGWYG